MELAEVCGVHALVTEHAVDREVLARLEPAGLIRQPYHQHKTTAVRQAPNHMDVLYIFYMVVRTCRASVPRWPWCGSAAGS